MHYAVCSIVCAVSPRLCPTLSQYLFSLITMGACCGCLDGFFGRLLFRSAAFVFRHRLSVVFFFFLFFFFARVPLCLCTCARVPTHKGVDKDRGGKKEQGVAHISLPSHMVMYPSLSCLSFIWAHYCCFQRIWWVQNGWIFYFLFFIFFLLSQCSKHMLPYSSPT